MPELKYISPVDQAKEISFSFGDEVFVPTATTDFLISAVAKEILHSDTLLDLGCGIGIVGLTLFLHGRVGKLFASDVSKEAIDFTEDNAAKLNVAIDARVSDIFDGWKDHKFDLVINDISGVADPLATISKWFENVPSNSGRDGTDNVRKVLSQVGDYLTPKGKLFFPIISLSDVDRVLDCAKTHFHSVERVFSKSWFLPEDLETHSEILQLLRAEGSVNYEFKYGKFVCYTDIYMAQRN